MNTQRLPDKGPPAQSVTKLIDAAATRINKA
jgi:hypothetical protein